MPQFFRKMVDGRFVMVEQPVREDVKKVDLVQPASATVPQSKARYFCTACTPQKAFRGIGVLSMHFVKVHQDLREDRDSYRKYMRVEEDAVAS